VAAVVQHSCNIESSFVFVVLHWCYLCRMKVILPVSVGANICLLYFLLHHHHVFIDIHDGRSGTEAGFSLSSLVLPR
jgi:hypothetical protein